ncbi:DUF6114 domain-containing protein [Polycladomyces subterraneus]|uniref:DUF6114 domain-containing protein n=1 Tax=Polycladomyces subterraneus TaxID=1016997 RepID=A0ABT8IS22_9BACL|nr:DUF6114 domain-containing protein [Polycladomyces subterraneus]MDN4595261.1 DUF6114 domain-containing protein [Polycladomyces subterraneus]
MRKRAVEERSLSNSEISLRTDRRFDEKRRPKLALTLVCLSGLVILWIPVNLHWMAFVPGSFAFAGMLFGTLVLSCGVIGWLMPQYVRLLGTFAMILSIVSIIGALGGLMIGTLLGIVGGSLCIAWGPTSRPSNESNEKEHFGVEGVSSAKQEAAATWQKWLK